MAQSGSCPNPDLSNGAIVHSPLSICSELDNQKERKNEEGEEEDEEVELAEEVGEDVLMMAEAGEGQTVGKSREQSEREEARIIQMALLPNGVIGEEKRGGERLKENREGVEVGDEEHEMIDEQTREKEGEGKGEKESKEKTTVIENPCHFIALIEAEKGQEQILDSKEENEENRQDEENKQEALIASSEMEVREDKTNGRDNGSKAHQVVSTPDDAEYVLDSGTLAEESGEGTQLSTDDTDKTEVVTLPSNAEVTESVEDPTIDVIYPTGINEQVNNQDNVCHTSTVSKNGILFDTTGTIDVVANQTNQLTSENKDEMKNTDEKDKSESSKRVVESINNNIKWQQKDCIEAKVENEGTKEFVKYVMFASDDILDIVGEVNQNLEKPDLAFVPFEGQSRIEETKMVGINHQGQEEEQVRQVGINTLAVMDGGGQSMEEDGKTDNNAVRKSEEQHKGRGDLEMQEEKIVQVENQAEVDLKEPVLQCVEEVPSDTQQDMYLDQVEEAFELEEGGKVEPDKLGGGEITLEENQSTAVGGGDLQEHPSQLLKEAGTDWVGILREQLRQQAIVEDEKGGEEEEAMEGELEMAEEPVTVLDDEIEEIEESLSRELEEQKPATITVPAEDTIVETKDGQYQELPVQKVEPAKENDEKQKDEKGEVELDKNGRVKGLKQAMENGILYPELHLLRKEEGETARVLSPRRKDNDWIKKDQNEQERAPEMKDWRKELRPVKKDIWESERGRKQLLKRETSPEEKSLPRKEAWIKELKSVIKDESLPKKRDEQLKKKRVVLLEDGHSYVVQRQEMTEEKREEVKLISHRRVGSPLPPVRRNSRTPQDQDYEISLYVKVMNHMNQHIQHTYCMSTLSQ